MGIVNFTNVGPPIELICNLRDIFCISTFVETGTYKGNTAYWASRNFNHVITIEASECLYKEVTEKYQPVKNIEFIYGDSREKLRGVLAQLHGPSIFWLDGHWSGGQTYGVSYQCPLIEEIEVINSSEYEHFILIDDGRYFLSPPPKPHPIEQWPNICKVIKALNSSYKARYVVIFEDVIIATPSLAKQLIVQYCRDKDIRSRKEHGIKTGDCKQTTKINC